MSHTSPARTSSSVLPSLRSGLACAIAVAGTGRVRAVHRALSRRRVPDPYGVSARLQAELGSIRTERLR